MIRNKINNFAQYFLTNKKDFKFIALHNTYDPSNIMNYYLSQSHRAKHDGPMDKNGIPLNVYFGKEEYLPAYISMYALGNLENGLRENSDYGIEVFKNVVDYFIETQDSGGCWKMHLLFERSGLKKPWVSSMAQGLVISCLARAYKLFSEDRYLESAVKALLPFYKEISQDGVIYNEGDFVFYEEFPSEIRSHVLNGFIITIWGLLDLARLERENESKELYNEGIKTLLYFLQKYDLGYWSLYNLSKKELNPASLGYHKLHIAQLDVMHSITNNELFRETGDLWYSYLEKKINALRTLPRKIIWNLKYGL